VPVPADLVVLSGCETVKGRLVGGEGVVGLPRALLVAGASRVLASA
jgi:CHAT domain-containing protein